jgi:hypothetical protein
MILRIRNWEKIFENAASKKLVRLAWVAVPNKTDGEGYTALVDHPNAAAHLGAWYAIVEAASKQEPRGNLPGGIPQDIGGICRSLGRMSRLPGGIFQEVIPRLIEIGWLEWIQQDTSTLADSPKTLADSPNVVAESAERIEQNRIELKGTEQKHVATATFDLTAPPDPPSAIRPHVPPAPTFEDWWKVWWNKTAKADAAKAWKQAQHHGAQFLIDQCVADRKRFEGTRDWEWRVNLHPATWLRGRRWEDEVPAPITVVARAPNGSASSTVERAAAAMLERVKNGGRA